VLKLGAQVKLSVRRVKVNFSSAYPYQEIFCGVLGNLQRSYCRRN
jgi:hypothetical protein